MIYLDFAASTPIHPQALEVYTQVATRYFGNASSLHDQGSSSKQIVEASSKVIASGINGSPKGLTFTSGATESNFLAIQALLDARCDDRKQIISTRMEHSSVINVLERLSGQGYQIRWANVLADGCIDLDHLNKLLTEKTALVTVQHVNSELGVIQPIKEIGNILKHTTVLFHSDCVQSFGKIPIDVTDWGLDAISISGHKIYGPKGIGAVWINSDTDWKPLFKDYNQKKSLRFGTANTPGIAAFAAAAKWMISNQHSEYERISKIRSLLVDGFVKNHPRVIIEGSPEHQSPYILGIRYIGLEGQYLMLECSQAGLAISTGSACQVGSDAPNRSMMAIGKTDEEARQFVRLSFGIGIDEAKIKEIIAKIDSILNKHFKIIKNNI